MADQDGRHEKVSESARVNQIHCLFIRDTPIFDRTNNKKPPQSVLYCSFSCSSMSLIVITDIVTSSAYRVSLRRIPCVTYYYTLQIHLNIIEQSSQASHIVHPSLIPTTTAKNRQRPLPGNA